MSALMKWDFGMLDHQVDSCLQENAAHRIQMLEKMKPFLLEIQARLSAQGRRTDLKDTPNLTFTQYLDSKEEVFQYSVRSIKLFLSTGTTTRPTQPRALQGTKSNDAPTTQGPDNEAIAVKEFNKVRRELKPLLEKMDEYIMFSKEPPQDFRDKHDEALAKFDAAYAKVKKFRAPTTPDPVATTPGPDNDDVDTELRPTPDRYELKEGGEIVIEGQAYTILGFSDLEQRHPRKLPNIYNVTLAIRKVK